ncbi:MAG: circularly permuted type 2 ATP-grasp protein [Deltaproteobacteria bacterium]
MTAGPLSHLLDAYRPQAGVADELMRKDGSLRPVWQPLINLLSAQSPESLARRFAAGDAYLHDAGVHFRQHTDAGSTERNWPLSHIPVVIGAAEWRELSEGIVQRAELLERVMADLYGHASLITGGILPPELVAQNPEWLRPIVGARPRSGHFLHFLAFEIGRSPDGTWFVLGDRTQAPSGAGFALENRVATSRVFFDHYPRANVERLAGFFRSFRDELNDLREDGAGRVAILTPGPDTATYFEHAYIARYLGFMLLQSEDLRVEEGKLTVRTVAGPEPISVLWRRLDARFADQLELDEHSTLGTPGMVTALRNGAVTMANCLGSGILEARALLAFMPRISEVLLGEELKLPNVATWWCGQSKERAYVRANIERMMIGPAHSTHLPFEVDRSTVLGGNFRDSAMPSIKDWLEADGHNLVGQEAVRLSTTPAMIDGKLVPRPMTLRVFAARTAEGWVVMPGGYARIGRTEDPTALAMQNGGSVADVWVVSDAPVVTDTLTDQPTGPFVRRMPGILPSRAADNLFWLGRYVERSEELTRKLRAYHLRLAESNIRAQPLVAKLAKFLDRFGTDAKQPLPRSLLNLLDSGESCAGKVRDRFSTDGWLALSDVARTAHNMATRVQPGTDAAAAMSVILRKLAGFSGLVHDNMFRFTGWRFITIGRALERADGMAAVLAEFADVKAPVGGFDLAVEVGDSVMTHRRRYAVETTRNTVIDLMVLDPGNPRSIMFQIDVIVEQEKMMPARDESVVLSDVAKALLRLQTELKTAEPDEITSGRLLVLRKELSAISDALTARYLR